jgi:hypothetical protein
LNRSQEPGGRWKSREFSAAAPVPAVQPRGPIGFQNFKKKNPTGRIVGESSERGLGAKNDKVLRHFVIFRTSRVSIMTLYQRFNGFFQHFQPFFQESRYGSLARRGVK